MKLRWVMLGFFGGVDKLHADSDCSHSCLLSTCYEEATASPLAPPPYATATKLRKRQFNSYSKTARWALRNWAYNKWGEAFTSAVEVGGCPMCT